MQPSRPPARPSSMTPWIIVIVVVFLLAILVVPIIACIGASSWFLMRGGAPAGPMAGNKPAMTSAGPIVDYPSYDEKIETLVPAQVGRFQRKESKQALNFHDAKSTWSAFYYDQAGAEIHLRIEQHSGPETAYTAVTSDLHAATPVGTKVISEDGYRRKDRPAGSKIYGRYRNEVKNIEADAIWLTIGNLAIVIGSKDGQFAEEFLREYEKLLAY